VLGYRNDSDGTDEGTTVAPIDDPNSTADARGSPPERVVHRATDGQSISTAVAFAVAEFRGVDPVELANDTVIGATLDLELLDDLSCEGGEWAFEFTLAAERVLVESEGVVTVFRD
jgi:hypothetical protein